MAKINQALLDRLVSKLGVTKRMVYGLIDEKVRTDHLPKNLAAIALAAERGINITRYSTDEDLIMIGNSARGLAPSSTRIPQLPPPSKRNKSKKIAPRARRGNTVFVVHGRDLEKRNAMFTFLRALGLKPLEWSTAVKATGKGSPFIGEILEKAFQQAVAIVVLLTADDEAKLRTDLIVSSDPTYERKLTGQARPNVLFEAGMAFGRLASSTILVQFGTLRPFSDVAGRHVVHMSNLASSRAQLAARLADAGCNVDYSGTDWTTAGDFASIDVSKRKVTKKKK